MITFSEFGALHELVSSFNNSEQDVTEDLRLLRKIQAYSFEQVCYLFQQLIAGDQFQKIVRTAQSLGAKRIKNL